VVPRFLRQALSGGSVVLFGGGQQTRDFVYISDVVEALVSAATAGGVNRQIINIGSGVETSVATLADEIEAATGHKLHRIHNPEKSGGVPRLVADISKAKMLLGLRPLVGLADGLGRILREDGRFREA
jgi:UDP-glucose 4-epimerase